MRGGGVHVDMRRYVVYRVITLTHPAWVGFGVTITITITFTITTSPRSKRGPNLTSQSQSQSKNPPYQKTQNPNPNLTKPNQPIPIPITKVMRRHRTADTAVVGYDSSDGGSRGRFTTPSPLPMSNNQAAITSRSPPRGPAILSCAKRQRRVKTTPTMPLQADPKPLTTPPRTVPTPITPPDSAARPGVDGAKPASVGGQREEEPQAMIAVQATHGPPLAPATLPPPLRLQDYTPAQLSLLRKPNLALRIRNVSPDTFAAWERQHSLTGRTRCLTATLPYEYNAHTRDFAVKCMPSAYHDAVSCYILLTADRELRHLLPAQHDYAALGITLRSATDLTGFRLPGLAPTSRKIPDFALRLAPGELFPALVAEVAFTETWADLVQDAALHLLATSGVTRVVLAVKLWEDTCASSRAWPASVPLPAVGAAEEELHDTVMDVQAALLEDPGAAAAKPLVGALTAVVAVFVRTEDAALVDSMPASSIDTHCEGITCIYHHTFIEHDEPCDDGGEEDADGDGSTPRTLTIPLHLLYPPPSARHQPNETLRNYIPASAGITFDLRALTANILRAKPEMEAQRAVDAAMAIVDAWKAAQAVQVKQQEERKVQAERKRKADTQLQLQQQVGGAGGDENTPPNGGRWMRSRPTPTPAAVGNGNGNVNAPDGDEAGKAKMWQAFKKQRRMERGVEEDGDHDDEAEG
ncbi:hypothetical protein DFH27DRAFT_567932 [Peziza echinospora]|nr:hypothetical protein DFH27DRAFT_567932 [Peziza echinospora]